MNHDDFEFEPIRGVPAVLPAGEDVLWQGAPRWTALAVRAYHVRKVAIYFAALVAWRIALGIHDGHTIAATSGSCVFLLLLGGVAIGVLSLLAYLNARSTVYTVTSSRVLLRHGVAVPLTMNVPFTQIESADVRAFADGTGDISLTVPRTLPRGQRIGYLITWPHVRPGRITHPAPCLRALPEAARVAHLLGRAVSRGGGVASAVCETDARSPTAGHPVTTGHPVTAGHSVAA